MRSDRRLNYVDLFAGCGGLSEGLEQSGAFNLLAAVEWNKAARDTFVERLKSRWGYGDAERRTLWYDIQKTDKLFSGWNEAPYGRSDGLNAVVGNKTKVHAVVGGPPCQAYSLAGRIRDEHGMSRDYRNYLFESYVRVVERLKPDFFIFENVEGMLSARPGGIPIIKRVTEAFRSVGYAISADLRGEALFELSEFGVPQRRRRVIIIGLSEHFGSEKHRREIISDFYATKLFSQRKKHAATVHQAIADLPGFRPLPGPHKADSHVPLGVCKIVNHEPRYHNPRDIEIFKELASDVARGSKKYPDIESLHRLYTSRTGKSSSVHKYYVLRWNEPSNAIVAHLHKDGLRHIHPDYKQARSITVREAARLQTFEDNFVFKGGQGEQYKMIGNAVPPVFAKVLGEALARFARSKSLI
ncbi:MAG: DNA cytosine methyltransferase [Elusimicrobiota bacterium]|nr:DNA cytosine methyltransferase [Elusimicrobiota bacterium]